MPLIKELGRMPRVFRPMRRQPARRQSRIYLPRRSAPRIGIDPSKKYLIDHWTGKIFKDMRHTIDGGTTNPNYGKWFQAGSPYQPCFGCRCSCTDCTLSADESMPSIVRVVWGMSAGCDCLFLGNDGSGNLVNLHFLDSPLFGPFYCCLQPRPTSGLPPGGLCTTDWTCTNDLSCYTDYQYYKTPPSDGSVFIGVNCETTGTLATDLPYNLQVTCHVQAIPNDGSSDCSTATTDWQGTVVVTIHSPGNSPYDQNSGHVGWPDGTAGGGSFTCNSGPPSFTPGTGTCGAGNPVSGHPSTWNGFTVSASGCDPCLCTTTDWAIGPHNNGDFGTVSLTSCNNF